MDDTLEKGADLNTEALEEVNGYCMSDLMCFAVLHLEPSFWVEPWYKFVGPSRIFRLTGSSADRTMIEARKEADNLEGSR